MAVLTLSASRSTSVLCSRPTTDHSYGTISLASILTRSASSIVIIMHFTHGCSNTYYQPFLSCGRVLHCQRPISTIATRIIKPIGASIRPNASRNIAFSIESKIVSTVTTKTWTLSSNFCVWILRETFSSASHPTHPFLDDLLMILFATVR